MNLLRNKKKSQKVQPNIHVQILPPLSAGKKTHVLVVQRLREHCAYKNNSSLLSPLWCSLKVS
jgi:hypothetical protein